MSAAFHFSVFRRFTNAIHSLSQSEKDFGFIVVTDRKRSSLRVSLAADSDVAAGEVGAVGLRKSVMLGGSSGGDSGGVAVGDVVTSVARASRGFSDTN
jgi:hypothetical protein